MSKTVDIQTLNKAPRKTRAPGDCARRTELVTDVRQRIVQRAEPLPRHGRPPQATSTRSIKTAT